MPARIIQWFRVCGDRKVDEVAMIIVKREGRRWRDRFVGYRVLLDDRWVGSLRSGEECRLPVGPGRYRVRLCVDSLGSSIFTSREIGLFLEEEQTATLLCRAGPTIESLLASIRPHRYIRLRGPF